MTRVHRTRVHCTSYASTSYIVHRTSHCVFFSERCTPNTSGDRQRLRDSKERHPTNPAPDDGYATRKRDILQTQLPMLAIVLIMCKQRLRPKNKRNIAHQFESKSRNRNVDIYLGISQTKGGTSRNFARSDEVRRCQVGIARCQVLRLKAASRLTNGLSPALPGSGLNRRCSNRRGCCSSKISKSSCIVPTHALRPGVFLLDGRTSWGTCT